MAEAEQGSAGGDSRSIGHAPCTVPAISRRPNIPGRMRSLDMLRGLSALSVVFWHWDHFFQGVPGDPRFSKVNQPFYEQMFLFYDHGRYAVDMFFVLSGFVFAWLYADAVSERRIPGWRFFVLRLSRIYPLHVLTLFLVVLLQCLVITYIGVPVIYGNFDLYHFTLNLLLVSAWGIESGWSFNAPSWSVSIEMLLYILFFLLCKQVRLKPAMALVIAGLGILLLDIHPAVARGLTGFFIGATTFFTYRAMQRHGLLRRAMPWLLALTGLLWSYAVYEASHEFLYEILLRHVGGEVYRIYFLLAVAVLFPSTVLTLCVVETCHPRLFMNVGMLGDLSYSSYLLHFPLQLSFILAGVVLQVSPGLFLEESIFLLYVALLVIISLVSYRWFEWPLKCWLRGLMTK